MNRKGDKSLIVGLDIGTSKVTALVGEYSPGSPIEVIGIGSHESRGMKRGGYSMVSWRGLRLVEIIQASGSRKAKQTRMSAAWVSRGLNVERRSAGTEGPAVRRWKFDVGRSRFITARRCLRTRSAPTAALTRTRGRSVP